MAGVVLREERVLGAGAGYRCETVCLDSNGNRIDVPGVAERVDTGSLLPTFGTVEPAVPNTRVDCSPYGQSIFADAVDAIQSVDLAFGASINEVGVSKMKVFLSDVMFDTSKTADGKRAPIPFGKGDCTVFRKVMSTEGTITEFAPARGAWVRASPMRGTCACCSTIPSSRTRRPRRSAT